MITLEKLRESAKSHPIKIIFPEGEDERVIQAANILIKDKLAIPVIVKKDSISGIECLSPYNDKNLDTLIEKFYKNNWNRLFPFGRKNYFFGRWAP